MRLLISSESTTAAEVIEGIDLTGERAVVTGASSGIGVETARALAGAEVTLAVRNTDAGDRASVAAFVATWSGPLHLLVNNAGVMALLDLQLTPEGWEMQFVTYHLGHFALALGLHDALAAAGDARIVALSSGGHLQSPVIFDDLNFASRPYDPWLAYGQSKTAIVLFAVEATRRWAQDGITANAVHPGLIAATNLARYIDPEVVAGLLNSDSYTVKTPEQGAATSVLVATLPQLEGIGGRYFEDCNEAAVVDSSASDAGQSGVAAYALDPHNSKRLWDKSPAHAGHPNTGRRREQLTAEDRRA